MKRTFMTIALLLAGIASADQGWHRGWERRDVRQERRQVECERERVDRERARIEQERMRIEMERERIRHEEQMRREREAMWHGHHHPVAERCERPRREEPQPPPAPSRPTARIEVVWQSGPLVMR